MTFDTLDRKKKHSEPVHDRQHDKNRIIQSTIGLGEV